MIAELLQQQEYFAAVAASGQLPDRISSQVVRAGTPVASNLPPEVAARLGNPTSPHTPTPPITSVNHSSEILSPHVNSLHLRHPPQSPLIVPSHPSLSLPYVHHHLMTANALNHFPPSLHPDVRAQQEAQVRAAAMAMNSRFAYTIPPNTVPANNYGQPTERLQSSIMDAKSEQKVINDLSKIVQETRGADDKALHSIKSGRSKKDEKDKIIHPDRDDHENRHISTHDKVSSTSTIKPHAVRQPHSAAHYSSTIHQLSSHLASPHERITDSPIVVSNPYATGQARVPPIPISGQVDDHNKSDLSLSSHHYKSDNTDMKQPTPPAAHQTLPNIPYHSLGVLPGTVHIDGRTSNPAHSPSSHIYKKDSSHNQQMPSLHNPATVKRPKTDHSNKEHSRTLLSHQGSSISPGPAGMAPAHSPLPWHMAPNSHLSISQSPHVILSTNEQSNRRINPHNIASQHSSDVRVHPPPPPPPPPPAHTIPQPSNVPARSLPQTPPHASQVPDAYVLRRYPVMWQGLLALKNAQAAVQMHFISGNPIIARASLPTVGENGEPAPVRISQRMRLDTAQLDGVFRKLQLADEHCVLLALPCGKDQKDLILQSDNLRLEFINYLHTKGAAGIVNAISNTNHQSAFVIHIFPACEFTQNNLSRIAPNLLHLINEISHLVIIIASV